MNMSLYSNSISNIREKDWNKLLPVVTASNELQSCRDLKRVFNDYIGPLFIKHGLSCRLLICLNHKHFNLNKDEVNVSRLLDLNSNLSKQFDLDFEKKLKLKGEWNDIPKSFLNNNNNNKNDINKNCVGYISGPLNKNNKNLNLVAYKWKICNDGKGLEVYEYIDGNKFDNINEYLETIKLLNKNIEFQNEYIETMEKLNKLYNYKINFSKLLGIMLPNIPILKENNLVHSIELNVEKNRQSKLIKIEGKNIDSNPYYLLIKNNKQNTIETSWAFNGIIQQGCKSHCSSHCIHFCIIC